MGGSHSNRRSNTSSASASRTPPNARSVTPATSEGMSGLARRTGAGGVAGGRIVVAVELAVEVVLAAVPAEAIEPRAAVVVVDLGLRGVTHLEVAEADVGVDHQSRRARRCRRALLDVDVDASAVAVEHLDEAHADPRVGGDADVLGDDENGLAHPDLEVERAVAGRQVGAAQVDDQLARAELVALV